MYRLVLYKGWSGCGIERKGMKQIPQVPLNGKNLSSSLEELIIAIAHLRKYRGPAAGQEIWDISENVTLNWPVSVGYQLIRRPHAGVGLFALKKSVLPLVPTTVVHVVVIPIIKVALGIVVAPVIVVVGVI